MAGVRSCCQPRDGLLVGEWGLRRTTFVSFVVAAKLFKLGALLSLPRQHKYDSLLFALLSSRAASKTGSIVSRAHGAEIGAYELAVQNLSASESRPVDIGREKLQVRSVRYHRDGFGATPAARTPSFIPGESAFDVRRVAIVVRSSQRASRMTSGLRNAPN